MSDEEICFCLGFFLKKSSNNDAPAVNELLNWLYSGFHPFGVSLVQKQYLQKSDCCLILQFTHQNSFQAIGTRNPLQMEHPNLQFDTIVQWQGSVSAVLIAHCSSKPLVLLQLAKKNRMFCCSQSDPAVNRPAFFSQCCCPQFSAKCH